MGEKRIEVKIAQQRIRTQTLTLATVPLRNNTGYNQLQCMENHKRQ